MKRLYKLEITSTNAERNAYLKNEHVNIIREWFHSREEAQAFCDTLNNTVPFRYYEETIAIVEKGER